MLESHQGEQVDVVVDGSDIADALQLLKNLLRADLTKRNSLTCPTH